GASGLPIVPMLGPRSPPGQVRQLWLKGPAASRQASPGGAQESECQSLEELRGIDRADSAPRRGSCPMSFRSIVLGAVGSVLLVLQPLDGHAQAQPLGPAAQSHPTGEPKSLKERLSDKASDEQRVDNCKVPIERRGPRKRPGCEQDHAGAEPGQLSQ